MGTFQLLDDDDNEMSLRGHFTHLGVAHINPISLMMCPKDKEELVSAALAFCFFQNDFRKLAISILNMFDIDISATISGEEIDTSETQDSTEGAPSPEEFGSFLYTNRYIMLPRWTESTDKKAIDKRLISRFCMFGVSVVLLYSFSPRC